MAENLPQPSAGEPGPGPLAAAVSALATNRALDAAREFLQVASTPAVPPGRQLVPWLASLLGREGTARLVEAFVHFPCFYCRKGRMDCEACAASGHTEAGTPCEQCLGTRLQRCDFCNGSGWLTINSVPAGLQPLVIKGRGTLGARRMRDLLRQPLPEPSSPEPRTALRRIHLLILGLDRQMGVFENMFIAFNHLAPEWATDRTALEPLIARSIALAEAAEIRIGQLVRALGGIYRHRAKAAGTTRSELKGLLRWARFYESLVDPGRSLTGTGLTHQFLHEEIRRRAGQRPPDQPSADKKP